MDKQLSIPNYCRLNKEIFVSEKDVKIRHNLLRQFRQLPPEVFSRLRHFQPQTGCFNKCSFCSQGASTRIIEFNKISIDNIVAVIKAVSLENSIKTGYLPIDTIDEDGNLSSKFIMPEYGLISYQLKRKGIIYCYLDNDPALYGDLAYFIHEIYENLGVKTRIATVGFNRNNQVFNENFTKLSQEFNHCLSGLRLSISPYTYGWSNKNGFSKEEFEKDIGYLIHLFRHNFISPENERKGFCVEIRFKPLVLIKDINAYFYQDYFVLSCDNIAYVSMNQIYDIYLSHLKTSSNHTLSLSEDGVKMVKLNIVNLDEYIFRKNNSVILSHHTLHKLKNDDGIYYAIDGERKSNGQSFAKYFYPKTHLRKNSGFIDGERYLLNAILDKKNNNEINSWSDVDDVILTLENKAKFLDDETNNYIIYDIIPLIKSYIRALRLYNFPAQCFFDKNFTVDTGHICNLGRAYSEYKSLASRKDLPMTPNHERAFGLQSDLAEEGVVYRLAPSNERRKSVLFNKQSIEANCFLVEKLDLSLTATVGGQSQEIYKFDIQDIFVCRFKDCTTPMIPGQIRG